MNVKKRQRFAVRFVRTPAGRTSASVRQATSRTTMGGHVYTNQVMGDRDGYNYNYINFRFSITITTMLPSMSITITITFVSNTITLQLLSIFSTPQHTM